ncbi:glycoside hydrolase superfamily [Aspergillus pseudotamarii]|uniref:glucan endo-1,6-beta-glucosidase n=1 Tax=Aspergillus pseudotamarii TaxID=132259 RepID=A0A5N6SSG2_ASPPS|nr:glycoside hydrolase superfamily [Aspergillus pseudotamarii]KAE8136074.1 glycoside hydrolase superfamily [Aspergillus pseudotamarii]
MKLQSLVALWGIAPLALAWLPTDQGRSLSTFTNTQTTKIRGVNLGSHFIMEKWMASTEWSSLGCGDYKSEWDCVKGIGQDAANTAFKKHWQTWITTDDITRMVSYGLNTIRIPVGFWMHEELINDNEYYPRNNAMEDLTNVCQWASDADMYIIIDLHGLPGAQEPNQPFTGRYVDPPQFYQSDENAERAYKFYEWILEQIHANRSAFKNVGALELVNEPLQNTENDDTNWMVEHFYPTAIDRIRAKEADLSVSDADALHVTVMDDKWDSGGNPTRSLNDTQKKNLLFDDHNYEIYLVRNAETIDDMITDACGDNRTSIVSPKIVGEWSLAFDNTGDNFLPMTGDHAKSYAKWFSAQQRRYEALDGWVFWSWKTDDLPNVEQWNYQKAVDAGIINKDLNVQYDQNPC